MSAVELPIYVVTEGFYIDAGSVKYSAEFEERLGIDVTVGYEYVCKRALTCLLCCVKHILIERDRFRVGVGD